jgi:hypothetical protein
LSFYPMPIASIGAAGLGAGHVVEEEGGAL